MSSDDERSALAAEFDRHAEEESRILAEYRVLAEKLGDSAAGMLVNQVLTDEEMHHLLLRTMATWLRKRGQAVAIASGADRAELLRLTEGLQRHERETMETCRDLRLQLSGESAAVLGPLLDAMVLDSDKHHRLLAAVDELLKS